MKTDLKRYELFGWDYKHHCPLGEKEMAWYKKFLRKTGGPVLELACGTGRLLISIAREGYEVVGIDLSMGMLHLAKERLSQLPLEVQKRIRLYNRDMSNFQLDQQFGLIIIADNSLRELTTKEQQLSCLKCVDHHLQPGGKFLVTVRRFDPTKFKNGRRDIPWSDPIRHPNTNDSVRRRMEIQLSEDGKWTRGVMFYKTMHANGSETIEQCPFEAPVMLTDDYISLLSKAGFSSNVFVGYEEQEDDGKNSILCFVCDKKNE